MEAHNAAFEFLSRFLKKKLKKWTRAAPNSQNGLNSRFLGETALISLTRVKSGIRNT
jgi:hypothetical protein